MDAALANHAFAGLNSSSVIAHSSDMTFQTRRISARPPSVWGSERSPACTVADLQSPRIIAEIAVLLSNRRDHRCDVCRRSVGHIAAESRWAQVFEQARRHTSVVHRRNGVRQAVRLSSRQRKDFASVSKFARIFFTYHSALNSFSRAVSSGSRMMIVTSLTPALISSR